ncbi:saccharopine dehydrogenase [Candidatus Bathyarchaeota archaeon]|nr:MAG: saccharopine dehydrogenase [Candidatus Bathyarchaeota archaeon]
MSSLRALVIGSGLVGSEIGDDLARSNTFSEVVVVDAKAENLARLKGKKIRTVKTNVFHGSVLTKLLEDSDIVCGALPGRLGFEMMRKVIGAGKDLVDISYTPQDPFALDSLAKKNNCILVPQCGVAPGLSNICVGDASRRFSKVDAVRIMVGGLPRHPRPPLNYQFVFSPDDVINEYTRPARIIDQGQVKFTPALSGMGEMRFPGVGELEFFVTDGLGTLPTSFPNVNEMAEYTLRYPGHARIMESLRTIGLLDKVLIEFDGKSIEPRRVVLELMRSLSRDSGKEDLLAFRVEVRGRMGRRLGEVRYQMLDFYDPRLQATAMARTTAYTCTAVTHLITQGKIPRKGVVTPEELGTDERLFRFVKMFLKARRVLLRIRSLSK